MPRPYPCTQTKRLCRSVRVELTVIHSGGSFSPTDDDTLDAPEVPTGCPEPRAWGSTGVHLLQLGAAKPPGIPGAGMRPKSPVVAGF